MIIRSGGWRYGEDRPERPSSALDAIALAIAVAWAVLAGVLLVALVLRSVS